MEQIKLVKLEDESKNFLPNGYLILDPSNQVTDDDTPSGRSSLIVVLLRPVKNKATRINLQVFCESLRQAVDFGQDTIKLARIYRKPIDAPKFCMLTFAHPSISSSSVAANFEAGRKNANKQSTLIRINFQLKDSSRVIQVSAFSASGSTGYIA